MKNSVPIYFKDNLGLNSIFVNLCLVAFVFQQFGLNYHISFGSLGLILIWFITKESISSLNVKTPLKLVPMLLLSYLWVLIRYGYDEKILSIFPLTISVFFLFYLLRRNLYISPPSSALLTFLTVFLCVIAGYQLFFDKSFQIPPTYYAMGENLASADSMNVYEFYAYSLRANSIYSEPSYLGMILCCLYVLIFYSDALYKGPLLLLIFLTLILTGSGIGTVGLGILTLTMYADLSTRMKFYYSTAVLFGFLLIVFLASGVLGQYDFALFDRVSDFSRQGDTTFEIRFINPFILIFENVVNFDWFGVPSNFYDHFYYTNLYDNMEYFPGHNGILGLFIQFGVLGFIVLYLVFRQLLSPVEFALFFIIGSQNGALLTYEKAFSILFVLAVLRGSRARAQ